MASPPPSWYFVEDGPGPLPPSSLTEQRQGWPGPRHRWPVSALCQEKAYVAVALEDKEVVYDMVYKRAVVAHYYQAAFIAL